MLRVCVVFVSKKKRLWSFIRDQIRMYVKPRRTRPRLARRRRGRRRGPRARVLVVVVVLRERGWGVL